MVGNVAQEEFVREIILGVAKDRQGINAIKNRNTPLPNYRHHITTTRSVREKLHQDPQIHVKRYRMNDVMPTMRLDDYDLKKHREQLKIISDELQKYPHKKTMDRVINDLEYSFPTRALKTGGKQYQDLVNDPEFRKRWAPFDPKYRERQ